MPKLVRDGVALHYEIDGEGPVLLLTHGYSDALTRYFNEKGIEASALKTSFGDET